jgi:hypothetical protein
VDEFRFFGQKKVFKHNKFERLLGLIAAFNVDEPIVEAIYVYKLHFYAFTVVANLFAT